MHVIVGGARIWLRAAASHLLAALLFTAAVVLLCAPRAFGHAAFLGSDPAPGVRLGNPPSQLSLSFTEPLNRKLATAELERIGGGRVGGRTRATSARRLVVYPIGKLAQGAYRVRWHSVSTEDGHALEGTFSFGVRAAAASGGHTLERSPLARNGWARVGARIVLYVMLLLFAGALLLRVLLPTSTGSWLTDVAPAAVHEPGGQQLQRRERTLVTDLGVAATAAAALAALLEASDAARGLSAQGVSEFLLGNVAGAGRLAVIVFSLLALLLWQRRERLAATCGGLALGAVAASGHAGSASPRLPSIFNDWLHLLSGAIWLSGIALIVLVWAPAIRRDGRAARQRLARDVMPRFGRVALPAFVTVISTGSVSLLVQLGELSDLWSTPYGRVLAVKIALVAVIALLSWRHALRHTATTEEPSAGDRMSTRGWRVLRAQPLLGVGAVAAVALLATFPLPPRQLEDADAPVALAPCDPCPLPRPAADELAVADDAGRYVVAGWLRRDRKHVRGTIRVLDYKGLPAAVAFTVRGDRGSTCGRACKRFSTQGDVIEVSLVDRGRRHSVLLPARWRQDESQVARRLLDRVQRQMRRLSSLRQTETVTSGPGTYAQTRFRLRAPNRLAFTTDRGVQNIVIGKQRWFRAPEVPWQRDAFGSGIAFSTRSWFRWTSYAQEIRLLRSWRQEGRRFSQLALIDPGTPVWLRLTIDIDRSRVVREQQTAKGRFMDTTYAGLGEPITIRPPRIP